MFLASLVYWTLVPVKYRTLFVAFSSALALAFLQPSFTVFLFGMTFGVYTAAKSLRANKKSHKLLLGISVLAVFFLACKYSSGFMLRMFEHEVFFIQFIIVPLGVSYFSFKFIAFLLDVYRGIINEFSYLDLLCFILFLPTFPAGPIERFQNFESQHENSFDWNSYAYGLKRIVYGYAKKVILLNFLLTEYFLNNIQPEILGNISYDLSFFKVYTFLILALLYSYLDLSSYADLAIGFSRLFGYKIIEDMERPILKSNISEYWNSWHISLSGWCRNNVYFPVLAQSRRNHFALYCSFFIMGIWHNVTINWILWGAWHATGIIAFSKWSQVKRKFYKKHKSLKGLIPAPVAIFIGIILTCSYTSMSFAFIFLDGRTSYFQDPIDAIKLLLAMFI